jgi:hypothetical protein
VGPSSADAGARPKIASPFFPRDMSTKTMTETISPAFQEHGDSQSWNTACVTSIACLR